MARTKQNQRVSIPKSFTSRGTAPRPKSALVMLIASALTAVWAAAMLSPFGNIVHAYMFVFIVFYAGPVTLVSLSMTVMAGLVATDRIVLLIRHRVLLQSAHRSLGIIAVFGLVLHVLTKVSAGYVGAVTAFVPFLDGGLYIGLGTVAAFLMVSVLWTGLIRARFVDVGKPWMWRALHSGAYVSWPIAIVHGLNAGRAAATWVTVSYVLCVVLVVAALLVRLSVSLGRKREEQGQSTGSMAPVGKQGKPTAASRAAAAGAARRRSPAEARTARGAPPARAGRPGPAARPSRTAPEVPVGRSRRDGLSDLRDDRSGAAIDSWTPAGEYDTAETPRRRSSRFTVPEVPLAGAMNPDPRRPVAEPEDPWDSPRRWATAAPEDPWDNPRRRSADDDRYRRPDAAGDDRYRRTPPAEDEERYRRRPPAAGDERYRRTPPPPVDEPLVAPERPARRRPDPVDDFPPAEPTRPGRRRAAEPEPEPVVDPVGRPTRRGRRLDDDGDEESTAGWGRAARYEPQLSAGLGSDDDDDDDTPTLVDLASRRARKAGGGSSGRSSRRKQAEEEAEEDELGAYWTKLKGEAR